MLVAGADRIEDLTPAFEDDDLTRFEAEGAPPLPPGRSGQVEHRGARVWYGDFGPEEAGGQARNPAVLLHGSFDNSDDWGHQVAALVAAGRRVIAVDSRGRGRSTLGPETLTFELLATEVLAVLDSLGVGRADLVGWSDGAIIALQLAMTRPERVGRVFAFGVVGDLGGLKEFEFRPILGRVFARARRDHARLSPEPGGWEAMAQEVNRLDETEPNFSPDDLGRIRAPVAIVLGENDEFIRPEHADQLARAIPGAIRVTLPGVSHFAMLQRPAEFNRALLDFLNA